MGYVVSIGEMMIQMCPVSPGPLRQTQIFERYVAGSEGNTLAGLELLGVKTRFLSGVGDDELGLTVLAELQARGVDTSLIKKDQGAPTGVYFIQRGYPLQGKTTVLYYRRGSAASRLSAADITDDLLADGRLVLLTGITPALSPSCNQACLTLLDSAKARGIPVAFDTNVRITLLPDRDQALALLQPFIQGARYIFTGRGDLAHLFGPGDIGKQIAQLRQVAPEVEIILVKLGSHGAAAYTAQQTHTHKGYKVNVVDELGAGDAFNAAFLASILRGDPIGVALRYANAAGALTVTAKGDLEPLPTWKDLSVFMTNHEDAEGQLLR